MAQFIAIITTLRIMALWVEVTAILGEHVTNARVVSQSAAYIPL